MKPSQQAGILCEEEVFWQFLNEEKISPRIVKSSDGAAAAVREFCGVQSRSEITRENLGTFGKWTELVARYRAWQRAPEFIG